MKFRRRRCAVIRSAKDLETLTEHDRAEVERLAHLLRLARAAEAAGVPRLEAIAALFPDVYREPGDVS